MVMNAQSPGQKHQGNGGAHIGAVDERDSTNQQSLKPLKRNKVKRENSETDLHANGYNDSDSKSYNNGGQYPPQFNQKY